MIIEDVSITQSGIQVEIMTVCSVTSNRHSIPGDFDWPRMRACGKQIAHDVPAVQGMELVRVDQRGRFGILYKQFTFVESRNAQTAD